MKKRYEQDEKDLVFDLWKKGAGFSDISKIIDAKPGSIFTILRDHGGIKPAKRKRSASHLTLEEREEIRAGLSSNLSIRAIAKLLNRSPSTVSREVNRNKGRRWYKAVDADKRAWKMSERPQPCVLSINTELRRLVIKKLKLNWSPVQISEWLLLEYPKRQKMHISQESIYKTLYIRSRKTLEHSLAHHLRRGHKMRQGKSHSRSGDRGTINIVNGVSIHKRPVNAEKRRSVGHWEGDLVTGSGNTHIATLVDRKTRFTIILKLKGKDSESVTAALVKTFRKLPAVLRKSLTWDRGMELAQHAKFTRLTNIPVFFCDPQSPWQRGTNENTNSLIRQYFPKKTCLGQHSQSKLNKVAKELNDRPRKVLNFRTPREILDKGVALSS